MTLAVFLMLVWVAYFVWVACCALVWIGSLADRAQCRAAARFRARAAGRRRPGMGA
jgi:hypothetical protein